MSERDDIALLRDMLDAAREVEDFTQGETRSALDADRKLLRALMMSISITGETAAKISPEFQEANPQIPWSQIIGMRNRLVHGYTSVNLGRLWKTATEDVLALIPELETLIHSKRDTD